MSARELEEALVKHLEAVDSDVEELDAASCYLFGASCFERLAPVHERASSDQVASQAVRLAIDSVWSWLGGAEVSDWSELRQGILSLAELGESVGSPEQVAEFFVANAIGDFLGALGDDDSQYARYAAARNIDTIELLADELDEDLSVLFAQEMKRQREDLELLKRDGESAREALKSRSQGESVLGTHWFPS